MRFSTNRVVLFVHKRINDLGRQNAKISLLVARLAHQSRAHVHVCLCVHTQVGREITVSKTEIKVGGLH